MNVKSIVLIVYIIVWFWLGVTYIFPSHDIRQLKFVMKPDDYKDNSDNNIYNRNDVGELDIPKLKSASFLKKLHLNFPTTYTILMYVYYILSFLVIVYLVNSSMLGDVFHVMKIITGVILVVYITFITNLIPVLWKPFVNSFRGIGSIWEFYKQLWSIKHPENTFSFLFVLFGTLFLMIYPIRWILYQIKVKHPNNEIIDALYKYLYYSPKALMCDIKKSIQNIREGKTPKSIVYIFIVQMIIICLFFIIPPITRSIQLGSGSMLQKDAVYLDTKRVIGTSSTLHLKKTMIPAFILDNTKDDDLNIEFISFKLSFDTFIHQTGELIDTSVEKEIISYGGYPRITFDIYDHTFRVYLKRGVDNIEHCSKDEIVKVFETSDFRLQQWNHVDVQYLNGVFDVYINGTLVSTISIPTPCQHDAIVSIGDDDGIEGGIKNVIFKSLS